MTRYAVSKCHSYEEEASRNALKNLTITLRLILSRQLITFKIINLRRNVVCQSAYKQKGFDRELSRQSHEP